MSIDNRQSIPTYVGNNRHLPIPIVRSALGGVLMGLANLVPGVSGGTMILVTGLYDEFITSLADVTRLRFTRRNVTFLAIVGCAATAAIVALAGTFSRAVILHRSPMFSLFIGLTLGGMPLLVRMLKRFTASSMLGMAAGLAAMITIAVTKQEPPDKAARSGEPRAEASALPQPTPEGGEKGGGGRARAEAAAELILQPDYPRDVAAGALGMSAMVLPGISGSYMLLVVGRYETILASIAAAKDYAFSLGGQGDPRLFLRIVLPTAVGAIVSLVFLSNFLKWMLRRYEKLTLGLLLGVLLGSVVGIWPFEPTSQVGDYALGAVLAVAGFTCTVLLSRIST